MTSDNNLEWGNFHLRNYCVKEPSYRDHHFKRHVQCGTDKEMTSLCYRLPSTFNMLQTDNFNNYPEVIITNKDKIEAAFVYPHIKRTT